MLLWHTLATYFRRKYGVRVQKIPLDAGATCPNRDGTLSARGCIFCNDSGSGSGMGLRGLDLRAQWDAWYTKYTTTDSDRLFMAYLQSFSNTYGPASRLAHLLEQVAALPGCRGIAVGTRPDCLDGEKLALLAGCGGSSATSTAASTSTESTAESTSTAAAAPTGEKQTLEYWYHSADPVTDAYFEDYFDKINAEQDQYEIKYTSFSFADFQEKFQMAVSTDTMPDVVSLGFSNVATFTAQDSLLPLDDYLDQIETLDKIDSSMVDSMRNIGGGTLYGIPYAYNQEVAWYNTAKFKEKGIDAPPATQKEFLEDCEKYADPANSSYFYSLRGVRPYDSLVAWLWTYTDGLGYDGSWFDENGKCILGDAKFAEALDTYANLYKNNEVSGDSINNNFSQIVAEFGSGVSMYIIHNSSSESTHLTNLGEGNFAAARVLANDEGHYFASGLQPNVYCITNQGDDHDYSGAVWLMNVLLDAECEGGMCQAIGRVPCNKDVEEQDWYKNDPEMMLYASYLEDENYKQIQNPYWLTEFSTFISDDMTADFQAVLMGNMTAQDCVSGWAAKIDEYQAAYEAQA